MAGKKGSKNNVSNRGKGVELKLLDGKAVKPIMYKGERLGHGNYMAAKFAGPDGPSYFDLGHVVRCRGVRQSHSDDLRSRVTGRFAWLRTTSVEPRMF